MIPELFLSPQEVRDIKRKILTVRASKRRAYANWHKYDLIENGLRQKLIRGGK